MKSYLKIVTALAVFFGLNAGVASAGSYGAPFVEPPIDVSVDPVFDWRGSYIGLDAGSQSGTMTYTPGFTVALIPGAAYGIFGGHNWQNGNLVYGLEFRLGSTRAVPTGGTPAEGFVYLADMKGRVGIAMDKALIYGFAGPSIGRYRLSASTAWNLSGYNFGAGVDFAVSDNVVVGMEYLVRRTTGSPFPGLVQTNNTRTILARVGWSF